MTRFELAVLWAVALFAGLAGLTARIAWLLFGPGAADPRTTRRSCAPGGVSGSR